MAEASEPIEVELKVAESNTQRQLNISAGVTVAFCLVFLMLGIAFAPSTSEMVEEGPDYSVEWWNTPLSERHTMDLPMDTLRAQLPVNGSYQALPYEEHFVEVELPASEQDAGFPGPALMHVALWLPDVPEGTKIPVIMTIHPYYDFGGEGILGEDSSPNTVPDGGVGKWVYDTFVPHGLSLIHI